MIQYLNITPYSMKIRILKKCSIQDLMHYFHISKSKWNENEIVPNQKEYLENTIVTIHFKLKEINSRQKGDLKILYEDDFFIACYKPPFLLVHEDGNHSKNLQDRVNEYLYQQGWPYESQALHRIDTQCSGIVLFSKFPFFQGLFDSILANHDCIKEYYALVQGKMPFHKKTVRSNIARNRHNSKAMIIHPNGKLSISHIEVIKKYSNSTLCKVRIETGRKHQIRLQLQSIPHPIINDPIYGTIYNDKGLLLENFHMSFIHPVYKHKIDIQIPLDSRFQIKE